MQSVSIPRLVVLAIMWPPNPVLESVKTFRYSELWWSEHGISVFSFQLLERFLMLVPQFPVDLCFSSCLDISVCTERFSLYFDKYCIAPRKDFKCVSFCGGLSSFVTVSLSYNGDMPIWFMACPAHSISNLNNSDFPSLNQYPAFQVCSKLLLVHVFDCYAL